MRCTRTRSRRAAFTLLELLVVIILLGAFLLMASRLFAAAMIATRDAEAEDVAIRQFDAIVDELRRDVWSAADVRIEGEAAARLEWPDGGVVQWAMNPDGGLSRSVTPVDGDPVLVIWDEPGFTATFSRAGCDLVVHIREDGGEPQPLHLTSQLLWLQEAHR